LQERLQKLIAAAGIASRRHAEELIAAGEVTVNGEVVTEPGTRADPARDHIKVRGRLINPLLSTRENVYVLLNKPRGYLASLSDPENRPLVTELVPQSLGRLHPVGRLDFNTEGLIILTNDGDLTNYVTAARNKVPKVYEAKVKGVPPDAAIERLRRGIVLEDGVRTAPAIIEKRGETKTNAWFEVVLHEGRNQQIRRMFDAVGHSVIKLRRVRIGNLHDEQLPTGAWRHLLPGEVAALMRGPSRRGEGKREGVRRGGSKEARENVGRRGGAQESRRGSGAGAARESDRNSPRGSDQNSRGRSRGSGKKSAKGAAKRRGPSHVRGS
jgi:pseudouridine synthase